MNLFMDSGAFSADSYKKPVVFEDYMKFIKDNESIIEVYANLDVIGNAEEGWENQKKMEKAGLNPLPVFHIEDDIKYLHKCLEYTYFALGGVAGRGSSETRRIHFLDMCFDIICDKNGYPKSQVHGFGLASPNLLFRYPWYCMTEDHEVLTKEGWKGRSELNIGEEILCFDKGKTKWQNTLDIPTFDVSKEKLYHLYNRNFEAFVTGNHNWITCHINDKNKEDENKWKSKITKFLSTKDYIPRVGKYTFPENKTYTDEQVFMAAWFWTDGTLKERKNYKKDSIVIWQSEIANPEKCKSIEEILNKSNEKWCVSKVNNGMNNYEIYGDMSDFLLNLMPDQVIPLDFIFNLTKEQLYLFVLNSFNGDGYKLKNYIKKQCYGINVKIERKKKCLEVLRIACLLLEIPTSLNEGEYNSLYTSPINYVSVNDLSSEYIEYSGKIWCVQVPSKAFFTKCKNKIYVTGNSFDSYSWTAYGKYGMVLMPKMKNGKFRYDIAPVKVFVTEGSPKKSDDGMHLDNLSKLERKIFLEYIESKGTPMGKSESKKIDKSNYVLSKGERFATRAKETVEIVLEEGVINTAFYRDFINYCFYVDLSIAVGPYPRKFIRNSIQSLF